MNIIVIYILAIVLFLTALFIASYNQRKLESKFEKFIAIKQEKNLTGSKLANELLNRSNINNVDIIEFNGKKTDFYSSINKVIKLSKEMFYSNSISALGICSYEVHNAIKDSKFPILFKLKSFLNVICNIISCLFIPLILIGTIINISSPIGQSTVVIEFFAFCISLVLKILLTIFEKSSIKHLIINLNSLKLLNDNETKYIAEISIILTYSKLTSFFTSMLYLFNFLRLDSIFNTK